MITLDKIIKMQCAGGVFNFDYATLDISKLNEFDSDCKEFVEDYINVLKIVNDFKEKYPNVYVPKK